jgi:flagellar biosynthetic protein FlhB
VAAVGSVAGMTLIGEKAALLTAMDDDPGVLPDHILALAVKTIAAVLVATLTVASADLVWSRILWRRDNRMSRHEVKEELKQAEGDRMVKARLRSLRLDRSRKRMLSAVPRATMVVVNPTHYAVAMRYLRNEGGAPMVLAKGVDLVALKIRAIAAAHEIPVVEDKPLARSLYAAVEVERPIPAEFYRAVAEIVHMIQQRKTGWPHRRASP